MDGLVFRDGNRGATTAILARALGPLKSVERLSGADEDIVRKSLSYQDGLAILLGLTFGIVMFDRNAINFLAPLIVTDLKLSNAQLGIAASVVALTWAIAGCVVGRISDASGRRKPYLVLAAIVFSLCSIASGFAGGFVMLVTARLLMGLGEGPVGSLSVALIFDASGPQRRGLNYGILAFCAGLVGSVLAPIIVVTLGEWFDWRVAFYLTGIPGVLAAVAIALYVRESPAPIAARSGLKPQSSILDVLRVRNVWLCALIASLILAFFADMFVFLPLFLVRERQLSAGSMGSLMTVVGTVVLFGGLVLPALSDRFGRRTILVACAPLGAALPLACVYGTGGFAGLVALCALAGLVGALPFVAISIIPAESALPRDCGIASGLVMGTAEILGGFAAPAITGVVADHSSLLAAPIIAGGCALAAGLLSLCLEETAPARLRPRPICSPAHAMIVPD
jgi:MFS family permease